MYGPIHDSEKKSTNVEGPFKLGIVLQEGPGLVKAGQSHHAQGNLSAQIYFYLFSCDLGKVVLIFQDWNLRSSVLQKHSKFLFTLVYLIWFFETGSCYSSRSFFSKNNNIQCIREDLSLVQVWDTSLLSPVNS